MAQGKATKAKNTRLIEKVSKYLKNKPKGSFWRWAFITLLFFHWFSPMTVMYVSMFQIGLLAPELNPEALNDSYQIASNAINKITVDTMFKMVEIGQNLSTKSPIIGRIISYGLSAFMWGVYIAMLSLVFKLCRYGFAYIYRMTKDWRKA